VRHVAIPPLALAAGVLVIAPALAEQNPASRSATRCFSSADQTSNCMLGTKPNRQCSPGSYYSALSKERICAPSFRTDPNRDVSTSKKHAVEIEYGMEPKPYGRTLQIDAKFLNVGSFSSR
jgi:hypothetical protein